MKRIAILLLVLLLCMLGCSSENLDKLNSEKTDELIDEIVDDLEIDNTETDSIFVSVSADYPMYSSASEIVSAATNIYTGTVKEIAYEIIDMKTAKADESPESVSTSRMLYTVYTVELSETLKGESATEIKVAVMGGIKGYKEEEQYGKLESSNLLSEWGGIPVVANKKITLGSDREYLFCVNRFEDYDLVINLTQFAYHIDSENATAIMEALK